eukprot:3902243-Rhodomonas_salina.1
MQGARALPPQVEQRTGPFLALCSAPLLLHLQLLAWCALTCAVGNNEELAVRLQHGEQSPSLGLLRRGETVQGTPS